MIYWILALIILAPGIGSLIAGLGCRVISKKAVNNSTILMMLLSFVGTCYVAYDVIGNGNTYNFNFYNWAVIGDLKLTVGLMIDQITVFMMVIVTFVSTIVHIYSIGYMKDDSGYARFFSYISGFTFMMLCLVMGNNFLMLFFGWEGVGLFSYLLIGFWFDKEKSNQASFKAFIANRVGDLGFLIGIAVVLYYFGSLDYTYVFDNVSGIQTAQMSFLGYDVNGITLMCILLFIGAMGKSAQVPLHMWLEGSMEGPTPISALIHAATMVTAGVFMVARLSPMFELSQTALSFVLIIGAITCLFMGLLAIVQFDIKRVIAYCTLSQLGYMMVAQGSSAFSVGMFHLMTHAGFKALLFLAAGSVIVAMHHEQDMRKMGNLKKYMPITYVCMLIGALALAAIPPFSGFFSKDLIIESVGLSNIPGSSFAYFMVTASAFVTSFYIFRLIFMTFHGKERMDDHTRENLKESGISIIISLLLLTIPALFAGFFFFNHALDGFFGDSIYVADKYNVVAVLASEVSSHGTPWDFMRNAFSTLPFWLAISGLVTAYLLYVTFPNVPKKITKIIYPIYWLMVNKYLFDVFYDNVIGKGTYYLSLILWKVIDVFMIDKIAVNGTAKTIFNVGKVLKKIQTGYIYHYVFIMIIAMILLMFWVVIL